MTSQNSIKNFLHKWQFGIILAIFLILLQIITLLIIILSTPNDTTWLGGISAYNFHDIAVYINYLEQGKNSFLLNNLYNAQNQIPRFDFFWSIGGILVRFGMQPKIAHEVLRYISTFILSLTIYWIAKKQTTTETHARFATLFMFAGMSTGILNAIWQKILYGNSIIRYISPDLDSNFAIGPMLFAGAHAILALALQFISVYLLWSGNRKNNSKQILIAGLTSLILTLFQPYYIPLLGLISLIILIINSPSRQKNLIKHFLLYNIFLTPSAIYYFYLTQDQAFKTHHFQINSLPLANPVFWIITLLPFFAGYIWLKINKEKLITQTNQWAWVWIMSAVICMIIPFPWTRKYTQGLLPVLIITTLPFWFHVTEKILKDIKIFIKPLLLLACFLPYLYLFYNTLNIINDTRWRYIIYQPNSLLRACKFINTASLNNSIILTDNLWADIWVPAYTNRFVWIGHPHETPAYQQKLQQYQEWLLTNDANQFNNFLYTASIDYLITEGEFTNHTKDLINQTWHPVWHEKQTTVWKRID